jgi:hypothetical protein
MAPIAHRFHTIEADGPWTSPPFSPAEHRHIVQGVIGGFIMGRPRWAEDLDGNFIYGLDAKGKEMKSAPSAKSTASRHHAAKKKSPTQLDREIAEALSGTSESSTEAERFAAARLVDRLRSVRQTAAAASRLKSRGAKQHGRSADYWAKSAEQKAKEKRYNEAQEDLDRAEMYIVQAARAAGLR